MINVNELNLFIENTRIKFSAILNKIKNWSTSGVDGIVGAHEKFGN